MTATGYLAGDPRKLDRTGYLKGDVVAGDAAGTLAAVPVGLDTLVLTADSGAADGVSWQAGGGGGGGIPSGTVVTETGYGQAPAAGVALPYSRGDHTHGSPALTAVAPGTTEAIGTAAALGAAGTPARGDHVHPMAAAGAPVGSAPGDTQATGAATTFAASDHRHAREAFGSTAGTVAQGNDSRIVGAVQASIVDAKGDLIVGTANDTVARKAAGTNGQMLRANSATGDGLEWDTVTASEVGAVPDTGGTIVGDLVIQNAGPTKAYRLRASGGSLDFDAAGAALFLSTFANADFTGTQRQRVAFDHTSFTNAPVGRWEFYTTQAFFGTLRHIVDATAAGDVIINEDGAATNFRVESDTDANIIAVTGSANKVQLAGAATSTLAFFGAAGATQPTVTGSRGGNAALASLLTALANLGLIVNSTTA